MLQIIIKKKIGKSNTLKWEKTEFLSLLWTRKMTNLSTMLLDFIHYCSVENILTYCITAWCERRQSSYQDRYQYGTENHWTPIYRSHCLSRACKIVKDNFHHLSSLLPSGRHYRALKSCSPRLQNSVYPTANGTYILNSLSHHNHDSTY